MTWGTAAAQFDVPGEHRGRRISIDYRRGAVAKSGKEVNATGIGFQHQSIVTKGQMMSAVVKYVERDLGRCVGIDAHRPDAANDWCLNRCARTEELSAVEPAAVCLCAIGCERIRCGREEQTGDNVREHSLFRFHVLVFPFVLVQLGSVLGLCFPFSFFQRFTQLFFASVVVRDLALPQ